MDPGTLNAMSEGMYLNLMMVIQVIVLIAGFAAVAGLIIYLIGIAWLCFSDMRPQAPRRRPVAPKRMEPDEYDLRATLAGFDNSAAGEPIRREERAMRHAYSNHQPAHSGIRRNHRLAVR